MKHSPKLLLTRLALCIWLIAISLSVDAQKAVTFEALSLEEGLSQSSIYSFAEDSEGYLWIATETAADRFDGYHLRSFQHDPRDASSLPPGSMVALFPGPEGYLWMSTTQGVARYDPRTESIQRVFALEGAEAANQLSVFKGLASACDRHIIALMTRSVWMIDRESMTEIRLPVEEEAEQSRFGSLLTDPELGTWITDGRRLWRLDCDQQRFVLVAKQSFADARFDFGQSLLAWSPQRQLLWASRLGVSVYDPLSNELLATIQPTEWGHDSDLVQAINVDPKGGLWLVTSDAIVRAEITGAEASIARWRVKSNDVPTRDRVGNRPHINIAESGDGLIWMSVGNLLGVYNANSRYFQPFAHDPTDESSVPPTVGWLGYELFQDRYGVVWLGSKLGGVARYVPQRHRFDLIRDYNRSGFVVRGVAEEIIQGRRHIWVGLDDAAFQLWMVTEDGGYQLVPSGVQKDGEAFELKNPSIRSMVTHPTTGQIWFNGVAWYGRLNSVNRQAELLGQNTPEKPRFRPMAFSSDGRYLYRAVGSELHLHELDRSGGLLESSRLSWIDEVLDDASIRALAVLHTGQVLLATNQGTFLATPWTETVDLINLSDPQSPGGQPSVISIKAINNRTVWMGTQNLGLIEADLMPNGNAVSIRVNRYWTRDDGLPDLTIYAIEQDLSGDLWVSSNRGLSRINLNSYDIQNFSVTDGLQAYEFNRGVAHRSLAGQLYFGGINGVSVFSPETIRRHETEPTVHLTRFELNRQDRIPGDLREMAYDENNWVFEYVGLHFIAPQRNRFAYQLEGLDPDWVDAGTERIARYTALPAGNYRFWVKSANSDGVWSKPKLLFEGRIAPAPWLSVPAYISYIALGLLGIMIWIHRNRTQQIRLRDLVADRTRELEAKNELVTEQSKSLQEALNARTLFFANVSHELRTPLTLIDAHLNKLDHGNPESESVHIAQKYLRRMTRLVDQLLDLSQIKLQGVQTASIAWSLNDFVEQTLQAFEGLASAKNLSLEGILDGRWETRADLSGMEKVLLNLLSNAIKFTPEGGRITVILEEDPRAGVWLRIKDTGPGIPADQQAQIFDRFHRVAIEEHQRTSGAGLGLALVSEAVGAMGGTIEVSSQLGSGSTFSVWVPAEKRSAEDRPLRTIPPQTAKTIKPERLNGHPSPNEQRSDPQTKPSTYHILVVEDNADLRAHLAEILEPQFCVLTAIDGLDALEKLKKQTFDLIVSDIMMPHLDGLGLLKQVRDDLETSHIPFLFLTARGDEETELQSLMLSADDFLTKPFEPQVLTLKLKNLLERQERLREHLTATSHSPETLPSDLSPRDQKFLKRLTHWIEDHYSDPELTVGGLADALAVDERTLQRKVQVLFSQTPAHYINSYRIDRACELLKDPTIEIQEAAYACGYNSARYFSRVFAKHRGQTPSQWRRSDKA